MPVSEARVHAHGDRPPVTRLGQVTYLTGRADVGQHALVEHRGQPVVPEDVAGQHHHVPRLAAASTDSYRTAIAITVAVMLAALTSTLLLAWRFTRSLTGPLDKALAARDPLLAQIKTNVYLRSLHSDQRWNELLKKIGLPTD